MFYCDKLTSLIKSITFLSTKSNERYLIKTILIHAPVAKSIKRTSSTISFNIPIYVEHGKKSNINIFHK